MMKSMLKLATIAGVLSVSACTTVPDSIVTGPKTARPQPAS